MALMLPRVCSLCELQAWPKQTGKSNMNLDVQFSVWSAWHALRLLPLTKLPIGPEVVPVSWFIFSIL